MPGASLGSMVVEFSVYILIILKVLYYILPHNVASESEITPCNTMDKPLVVYRFSGDAMTSIITLLEIQSGRVVKAYEYYQTCIATKTFEFFGFLS